MMVYFLNLILLKYSFKDPIIILIELILTHKSMMQVKLYIKPIF